jgi:hypothetical protein
LLLSAESERRAAAAMLLFGDDLEAAAPLVERVKETLCPTAGIAAHHEAVELDAED